jgi:predicted aspartyl protease
MVLRVDHDVIKLNHDFLHGREAGSAEKHHGSIKTIRSRWPQTPDMRYLLGLVWMTMVLNGAVKLRFSGSHVLVDGVYVNGQGPYRFLLDTGAEATSVSPELARRGALVAAYRVEVVTLNGKRDAAAAKAAVRLENVTAWEAEVVVQDLGSVRSLDRAVEGVLGQSFLGMFRHRVDYGLGVLTFEEDPESFLGERVPLERLDGALGLREGRLRLVLDSGVGMVTLFGEPPEGFRRRGDVVLDTTSGRGTVPAGELKRMRIGGVELKDVPVVMAGALQETSMNVSRNQRSAIASHGGVCRTVSAQDRQADGLLPLALFRSVYIDPRERWAILNPKPAVR